MTPKKRIFWFFALATNVASATLTCPENTYASSGAVLAFNPSSASEESFTRVALGSKNVGETSWPLQTSSGFTLITKFKFTGTGAWFENVAFFGKDGSIGTIWLRRYGSGSEELLDFRIYQGSSGISTDPKCTIQSAAGSAPQNTVLNIIARWDGSVIELDINGVKGSADCSLVMQNRVLSETYMGSSFIDTSIGGFVDSSRFLLGDMYGMYAWSRHLSDSEAAQVLAGIEIGGPDTLPTLQCTSCPTNGDFMPTCPCPAETHFGSPGVVVAFNPSGNEATFVRSSSHQIDLGTVAYNIQTNGGFRGFTLIAKFMFSDATNGNYERIFGAMNAYDSDVNSFFLGRHWTSNALLVQFGDSAGKQCKIDDIVIAQNTQYSAVITYKASTNTVAVKLNDQSPVYKQCTADFNLPDFTVSHNKLGAPGYSNTEFFGGTVDGLYVFSRFLEEEQASQVLEAIEIGGPDTLPTLQCCAADGTYTPECGCGESAFQTTDTPINDRVISFNPAGGVRTFASASDYEDFGDSNSFAIKTNGGMTLLMKFRIHSGITVGGQYPSIFAFKEGAGTGRQNNFYLNIATTMYFTLVKEDISDVYGTTACGMSSLPRPPENEYVDMIVVYDKDAQLFSISFSHINNGVAQTSACPVDLGDRTGRFRFNDNLVGSTEGTGYRGDVAGFYAYDRVLSSAEIDTILNGIKTDAVNEDTITVCAACPTDGTYLAECGCQESFYKNLKPVSAEIHMNTGVKKNWDDADAAAAAAGTRLFTCTELKEYLQQNGPIDANSASSWVACTGSPSCGGKDFVHAGPSQSDRSTGQLQDADKGWGCIGTTRYDSTQIFMFYVPEKFECAACPTDGTVVEGCQPPCVDVTSFSYWSIKKSTCP